VSDPRTRFTRALLLAAAAAALVALVAVAAGGYRLGGSDSTHASPYALDVILSVVIALYILGAVGAIVLMFWGGLQVRRYPRGQTKRERTLRSIALLLAGAALATIAVNHFHWRAHARPHVQSPPVAGGTTGQGGKTSRPHATQQPQFRLAPFLAVLGAAGVALGAFAFAERGRRRRLPEDLTAAETLSQVLDETLDDLRDETEPRRAVIGAYARMERSLAAHGIPRHRFEAPHEYLGRVLGELSGGRLAAARLTALFERARFSPHEIDAAMKDDAIDAIESLQRDLAAAEAAEAA
jgi:hypothetical protein